MNATLTKLTFIFYSTDLFQDILSPTLIMVKKRCLTATKHLRRVTFKTTSPTFYLLPKNSAHTPLPVEELKLIQVGMGRQMVSLPEHGDHTEVQLSVQLLFNLLLRLLYFILSCVPCLLFLSLSYVFIIKDFKAPG